MAPGSAQTQIRGISSLSPALSLSKDSLLYVCSSSRLESKSMPQRSNTLLTDSSCSRMWDMTVVYTLVLRF